MISVSMGSVKSIYAVRQWPSDVFMLIGPACQVFEKLGISGKGKRQKAFLAASTIEDMTIFADGTCYLVSIDSETAELLNATLLLLNTLSK